MNPSAPLSITPRELVRLLIERRKLWLAPAIGCTVLAAAYSLVMPRYWEASQALVVRQETAGSQGPTPGKFADLYEMRTMQETILELAKSQQVVVSTLKAVDRKLNGAAKEPTAEDIEKFRGRLKMLPPDGGEFGKTEVFYFYLKDCNRERAIELVGELCRQLNAALKELRAKRAEGLIAELEEQVALATQIQEQETRRLEEFEAEVGADLGELRMLHSASSGQSDLRQEAVQLEADVRKFETELRQSEQLLAMLKSAEQDAQQLIATPNSLLVSQPSLRRLKEGLVDAQLATSRLGGTRSDDHPRVKAAVESEEEIRADLRRELLTAIRGAEAEIRLGQQRVESTRARLNVVQERLSRLAERRAEYSNRVAAVENSRVTLDRARQNLSTAKAAEAAARSGSLVTRIDNPETGPYPAGPGRTVVTGAGAVGGLMLGLGLVFLTTGSPNATASAVSRHGQVRSHEVSHSGETVSNGSPSSLVATRTAPPGPISEIWPASAVNGESPVASPPDAPGEPLSGVVFHPAPNGSRRAPSAQPPNGKSHVEPVDSGARGPNTQNEAAAALPPREATPANGEAERTAIQANGNAATSNPATPQELIRSAATSAKSEAERSTKAPQPAPANVLPAAAGALPALGASSVFGGMSLQEALQAAREAQR